MCGSSYNNGNSSIEGGDEATIKEFESTRAKIIGLISQYQYQYQFEEVEWTNKDIFTSIPDKIQQESQSSATQGSGNKSLERTSRRLFDHMKPDVLNIDSTFQIQELDHGGALAQPYNINNEPNYVFDSLLCLLDTGCRMRARIQVSFKGDSKQRLYR